MAREIMLTFAATRYEADKATIKAATEQLTYDCVCRLYVWYYSIYSWLSNALN